MTQWDRIYLSPHFDDAVFSCGATIHCQHSQGDTVLVVTVFSAPPVKDVRLSPFAKGFHCHMACGRDPVAVRHKEDKAALARLGAAAGHLGHRDGIYRMDHGQWRYPGLEQLFGPVHPGDAGLCQTIAGQIEAMIQGSPCPALYFPAAIGNHVDHQIVHQAGQILAGRHPAVGFYEDYPYADPLAVKSGTVQAPAAQRLARIGKRETLAEISDQDLAARVDAMSMYRSQLRAYPDPAGVIRSRLREFLKQGHPPVLAERFWL